MNTRDSLQGVKYIHMLGIGGIGVSALAPMLVHQGFIVSGTDRESNAVTERLQARGIKIFHDHKPENIEGVDLIVVSSAIKPDNPELAAAHEQAIPVWHRAEMLGHLMNKQRGIVVTGAHGKTTISAMLAQVLIEVGEDPSVFIGGDLSILEGNSRVGEGEWVVAEGDESDGSFVHLNPEVAIVNNIDEDHLDYYTNLQAIIEQFRKFTSKVPSHGFVLYSADCETCATLLDGIQATPLSYGFSEHADIQGSNYRSDSGKWCIDITIRGKKTGKVWLPFPGKMNFHNALAVVAICDLIAIPFGYVVRSLSEYVGVQRRLELKGQAAGVTVVDDYAHHPAEVKATIDALRDCYAGRLVGVFQPHLFSRTLKLAKEFGQSFAGLDTLILTDIYPAREQPIPGVTGELLVHEARKTGLEVGYVPEEQQLANYLNSIVHKGDVVVTMGAGSIWKSGEELLELLKQREASGLA